MSVTSSGFLWNGKNFYKMFTTVFNVTNILVGPIHHKKEPKVTYYYPTDFPTFDPNAGTKKNRHHHHSTVGLDITPTDPIKHMFKPTTMYPNIKKYKKLIKTIAPTLTSRHHHTTTLSPVVKPELVEATVDTNKGKF